MKDLPCSREDMEQMLRAVGVRSTDDLFSGIPDSSRCKAPLDLPPALCEVDLLREFKRLAEKNEPCLSFLGAGAYPHFIPAVLDHILLRSEFFTAYTPYQPEVSQGTLQAIFEYQTLMSILTGMDVCNASLYDGATALVEGVMLALRVRKGRKVFVSKAVHPKYRAVLHTYLQNLGAEIIEIPVGPDGRTDIAAAASLSPLDQNTAAVAVQSPNFYGVVEDLEAICGAAMPSGALFVACVTECYSLGLLNPPGDFGADVVVGEAQSFGMPLGFGGPYLGFIATRKETMRNLPGRLVGETRDADGKRGYVITLATREQHIRREKATSNICTNESLCALTAAVHLNMLGKAGLQEAALRCFEKAEYLKSKLTALRGVSLVYSGPTFNEFVVELPGPSDGYFRKLLKQGIACGLPLGRYERGGENRLLVCCTEVHTRDEMDRLTHELERIL
jgi:glycine dehydrogenase subunit 1